MCMNLFESVKAAVTVRQASGCGSAAETEISAGKGVPERGTALSAGIVRLSASFGALEGAIRTQNTGGIWGPRRNPAKRFRWGEDEQRNE